MFLEPSFFLLNASFASFTRRSRLCMACSILCFSWTDWSVLRWYQPYATPNTRAEYRTTLVNQPISIHPKRSETGNVHSRWAKPWFKYSELFCGQTALRRISAVAYVITRNLLIKVIGIHPLVLYDSPPQLQRRPQERHLNRKNGIEKENLRYRGSGDDLVDSDLVTITTSDGGVYTQNLKNGEREVKKALHEESQIKVCSRIYYILIFI